VLLSGNHSRIAQWRKEQRIERTRQLRPDLWQRLQERLDEKS
jgi:tRNA (guanine37-N1)-methyltransferase